MTAAARAALKDPNRKAKCKIGLEVWDGKKCKKVKCPKGKKLNKKTGKCVAK